MEVMVFCTSPKFLPRDFRMDVQRIGFPYIKGRVTRQAHPRTKRRKPYRKVNRCLFRRCRRRGASVVVLVPCTAYLFNIHRPQRHEQVLHLLWDFHFPRG